MSNQASSEKLLGKKGMGNPSTLDQCKKRKEEGVATRDGNRYSKEASNDRRVKVPTINQPCKGNIVIMQGMNKQ